MTRAGLEAVRQAVRPAVFWGGGVVGDAAMRHATSGAVRRGGGRSCSGGARSFGCARVRAPLRMTFSLLASRGEGSQILRVEVAVLLACVLAQDDKFADDTATDFWQAVLGTAPTHLSPARSLERG